VITWWRTNSFWVFNIMDGVELVKALVRRSRPIYRVTQARIVGLRLLGDLSQAGIPASFLHGDTIGPYFHASAWAVFLLYAHSPVGGITRMYVGAHYPRDVLAGRSWAAPGGFWECLSTGTC